MTTITLTTSHIFSNISESLQKAKAALHKRNEVKRTMRELSALTDRELNDMGIARGDIYPVAHGHTDSIRSAKSNSNLKGWV